MDETKRLWKVGPVSLHLFAGVAPKFEIYEKMARAPPFWKPFIIMKGGRARSNLSSSCWLAPVFQIYEKMERGNQIFVDRCRSDVVKAVSLQTTPCAGNDVVQQLPLPSAQVAIGVFCMLGGADANLLVRVPVPIHLQRFSAGGGGEIARSLGNYECFMLVIMSIPFHQLHFIVKISEEDFSGHLPP